MMVKDYRVSLRCSKCNYCSSTAAYGSPVDIASIPDIDDDEVCPWCHSGVVSLAKLTFEFVKKIVIVMERWHFELKCGKCKKPWQSELPISHEEMVRTKYQPKLTCPYCGNMEGNFHMSIKKIS